MKRYLKSTSTAIPVRRSIMAIALPALFILAGRNFNEASAAGFFLPGPCANAPVAEYGDSVRAGGGMPVDELKSILERETGEPVIEGTAWERKKNPKTAMLCALTIPGLGQIYNEKPLKAALAAGFEIFYLSRILHYYRLEKREEIVRDGFPRWITTEGESPITYQNPRWTWHDLWVEEHKQDQIDYIWWSAGCILVIVLDAYIDAHLHDMNFRIEDSPLEDSAGLSLVVDF